MFDPDFDDTQWTEEWLRVPVALVPPAVYASGYRVERRLLQQAEIFGKPYHLSVPLDCRLLYDPSGRLWMSSTPQEHTMMYNNARRSWGRVLVGGLGLGLYPQYATTGAAGQAVQFTIIEQSPVVRAITGPMLGEALDVPVEIQIRDIEEYLSGPVRTRFDTIFLDTWDTLDASQLPHINYLRDLALRHLAPGGEVLLWGYRWMTRLFEEGCHQVLAVHPERRPAWLAEQAAFAPRAAALLSPVVEHFQDRPTEDLAASLAWCRNYIVGLVHPA